MEEKLQIEKRQYRKTHFVTLSKTKGLRHIISATSCHLDRRERSFGVVGIRRFLASLEMTVVQTTFAVLRKEISVTGI
jgi:hypothetical protein